MTHPSNTPPVGSIISETNYRAQLRYQGKYKVTSGGNRIRAWQPSARVKAKMRQFLNERDGQFCQNCGSTEWPEFDHITPYRDGGLFIESNLQWLCHGCNMAKGCN